MKHRFIPANDFNDDMLAGAMALGLVSAGVQFKYNKIAGYHRFFTLGEVPEACQPEKWTTWEETKFDTSEFKPANSKD